MQFPPIPRACPTIVLLGGGVYAAHFAQRFAERCAAPQLTLRLAGRRARRIAVISEHARQVVGRLQPKWSVEGTSVLSTALSGADIVILMVRVGGYPARGYDETFPRQFDLPGDEGLGLGGMANTWRTLPALVEIGRAVRDITPSALVINMTAPLPATTRMLTELGLCTVGLCELPTTVERTLARETTWDYAGLNHLGWFWPRDGAPCGAFQKAVSRGVVHPDTIADFHAIPLPYYYRLVDTARGTALGLHTSQGRADVLARLTDRIYEKLSGSPGGAVPDFEERPTPWFADALIPLLTTVLMRSSHSGYVNIVNGSWLAALPPETVVELRATFTSTGIEIVAPVEIPERVSRFLHSMAGILNGVYDATMTRRASALSDPIRDLTGLVGTPLKAAVAAASADVSA